MFEFVEKVGTPEEIKEMSAPGAYVAEIKKQRDGEIKDILSGKDPRKLIIAGPCSADCESAVLSYCEKLAALSEKVKDRLYLVPRLFSNKPRTRGGYKGLLFTPVPGDDRLNVGKALLRIRNMHIKVISETGLSGADELLYPTLYSYADDLISYYTVGARSSENQTHRIVTSGIEEAVGVKNPTSGSVSAALGAINMAQNPNEFYYRGNQVKTSGNPYAHLVLRGGVNENEENIPNYSYEKLVKTAEEYEKYGLKNPSVIVDTNHANSGKNYLKQPEIARDVFASIKRNSALGVLIKGLLIESYLLDGTSETGAPEPGRSITDACLGWEKTEELILSLAEGLW